MHVNSKYNFYTLNITITKYQTLVKPVFEQQSNDNQKKKKDTGIADSSC